MIIERKNGGYSVSAIVGNHLEQRFYIGYTKQESLSMFRDETRIVYLNMKSPIGRETVDELRREDFESNKAFRAELRRLVSEYHLCGMPVYTSRRACANWH